MRTLVGVLTFLVVVNATDGHWVEWNRQFGCEEIALLKSDLAQDTTAFKFKRYMTCSEEAQGQIVFMETGYVEMPSPGPLFVPEAAWEWKQTRTTKQTE